MEQLDIYDSGFNRIGVAPRSRVHREGLLHQVVHCWIYDEQKNCLYFQQRTHDKADFPDFFDTACGGHVDVGEPALEAMLRELREETGLCVTAHQLEYLGRYRAPDYLQDGFYDCEFSAVYLLNMLHPPFVPGKEVSRMIYADVAQYIDMEVHMAQSIQVHQLDGTVFSTHRDAWICHDGEFAAMVLPRLMTHLTQSAYTDD